MEARPLLINTETDEVKLLRDAASTSTKWTRIWIVVIFSVLSLLQVWILISRSSDRIFGAGIGSNGAGSSSGSSISIKPRIGSNPPPMCASQFEV